MVDMLPGCFSPGVQSYLTDSSRMAIGTGKPLDEFVGHRCRKRSRIRNFPAPAYRNPQKTVRKAIAEFDTAIPSKDIIKLLSRDVTDDADVGTCRYVRAVLHEESKIARVPRLANDGAQRVPFARF